MFPAGQTGKRTPIFQRRLYNLTKEVLVWIRYALTGFYLYLNILKL